MNQDAESRRAFARGRLKPAMRAGKPAWIEAPERMKARVTNAEFFGGKRG